MNKYFPFLINWRVATGGGVGERDVAEYSLFLTVGLDGADVGSFFTLLPAKDFEGVPFELLSSSVPRKDLCFATLV